MGKRHIIDKLSNSKYSRPALAGGLVIMLFFGAIPINQNALAFTQEAQVVVVGEIFYFTSEFLGAIDSACGNHFHADGGEANSYPPGNPLPEPTANGPEGEDCGWFSLPGPVIFITICDNPGEVCRSAADVCDRFEECTADGFCPADLFLQPNDVTSPCAVDQNECTIDPVCDGSGPSCPSEFVADVGKVCGPGDSCTENDMCDANAVCQPGTPKEEGAMCGDDTVNLCNFANTCDGAGTCLDNFAPADDSCIGTAGLPLPFSCDAFGKCDGMGACVDQFQAVGSSCGDQTNNACDDPNTCDASGNCLDNFALGDLGFIFTPCGDPSDTECTDPDTCDGAGKCQDNHLDLGFPFNICDSDKCQEEQCQNGVCVALKNEPDDTVCKNSFEPACTEDDTCQAGVCVVGGPVDCSDGDICTADLCFPGPGPGSGCFNGFPANPLPAVCQPNVCVTLNCNDNNACTADSCDPVTGCLNTAIMCDDSNQCTADSCNPASGCVFTPTTAMCNDADSCTSNDKCDLTGECVGDSVPACLIIDSGDTPTADFTLSYKCEDENTVTLTDVTYTEDGNVLSPSGMSFSCPDDVTVPLPITGTPNDFSAHVNINGIEGDCNIECVEPNDCEDLTAISFDLNEDDEVVCFRGEGSAAILILSPPTSVAVGGTFIPIDSAALLVAYAQNNLAWIIPLLMITAAIGFMKFGRSKSNENSI